MAPNEEEPKQSHRILDMRGKKVSPEQSAPEPVKIPDPPDYSKINLKMCGERVLIQNFPTKDKIGSIYTPSGVEIPIDKGRICGLGPDVKNKDLELGTVVFKVFGMGQTLTDNNGNEYIFLPEGAAIAIDTDPKTMEPSTTIGGEVPETSKGGEL